MTIIDGLNANLGITFCHYIFANCNDYILQFANCTLYSFHTRDLDLQKPVSSPASGPQKFKVYKASVS